MASLVALASVFARQQRKSLCFPQKVPIFKIVSRKNVSHFTQFEMTAKRLILLYILSTGS